MPPDLWPEYETFCRIRQESLASGACDLSKVDWIYPTTLLPLGNYILTKGVPCTLPEGKDVADYVTLMTEARRRRALSATYVPIVPLPPDRPKANEVIDRIYSIHDDGREYGGVNAFKYLIGELVNNVYEHSEFENAFVMAQRYGQKGFVEISFFDDGITIGGSLRRAGFDYTEDYVAIAEAVNGKSAKKDLERGYGLYSNTRLCTEGLGGNILIVSGRGGLQSKGKAGRRIDQKAYDLRDNKYKLNGTLISVRLPTPAPEVDFYDYIV